VEDITVRHSIVVGNSLNGAAGDLFTGSVLHFYSHGYNLVGKIDLSQILVPIPPWMSLSRKHWPKEGDLDNVALTDVLDTPVLDNTTAVRSWTITSVGTDNGSPALLWYPPAGGALDRIPAGGYTIGNVVMAEYRTLPGKKDDFLSWILSWLSAGYYGGVLGNGFGASYGAWFESTYGIPVGNVAWYESPASWPSDNNNKPWINFWRGLDNAIAGRLGAVALGDEFWQSCGTGQSPRPDNVVITVIPQTLGPFRPAGTDQLGNPRPNGLYGDIGAIERTP
jgi:hypothetical protein